MSFFNAAYEGIPPWDIGRPQREFVHLAQAGDIQGAILDVGCGTGENALYFAEMGHEVWGIDTAPTAIDRATQKASQRGVTATFLVADALELPRLGRTFDTVTDCGLFHTLSDEERALFARSLATVLRPGGTYFMMCFSEQEPEGYGPRRVTQTEIRSTFQGGWRIDYIRPARFESHTHAEGAQAWLSSISRVPSDQSEGRAS